MCGKETLVCASYRFGDLSVQEAVNAESWQQLNTYWEKYSELIGEPGRPGMVLEDRRESL